VVAAAIGCAHHQPRVGCASLNPCRLCWCYCSPTRLLTYGRICCCC
jgi:hypothetical protein